MFEVRRGESEVEQSKSDDCLKLDEFYQTFQGDFSRVTLPENNRFPEVILVFSVWAGLHKFLGLKEEE